MDKCIICKANLDVTDGAGLCRKCMYEVFGSKMTEHLQRVQNSQINLKHFK